jgi:hypothetical protein
METLIDKNFEVKDGKVIKYLGEDGEMHDVRNADGTYTKYGE